MSKKEKVPFEPLFARVLLERPIQEVSKGGIIIPDSVQLQRAPTKGVVVAVGDSCDEKVKGLVGKTIIFAKYAGDWLKLGEKQYFICQDEDILGVEHG